jgi:hypothetical protein
VQLENRCLAPVAQFDRYVLKGGVFVVVFDGTHRQTMAIPVRLAVQTVLAFQGRTKSVISLESDTFVRTCRGVIDLT